MTQAIEYLAKTCCNIIKAQGLSKADSILVASKVVELVASSESSELPSGTHQEKPSPSESPAPKPAPKKEEPPKVIARKGAECACNSCNKVVYKRVGDILTTMKGEDFTKAFACIGHEKEVDRFQNIEGNILVDCPLCGANASVALVGNVIQHQFKPDTVV